MKIKKKNTTIPINGKIVDTDNVEDKTSNAPSLRLVEEMIKEKYSTDEQVIGTWIDGKTIYKKTVIYTNTAIIGEKGKITEIYINHNISDFKQLCDLKCVTSDNYVPIPSIGSNNGTNIDYGTRVISVGSKQIGLRIINDTWGPRTWYFTLKYTKTTD